MQLKSIYRRAGLWGSVAFLGQDLMVPGVDVESSILGKVGGVQGVWARTFRTVDALRDMAVPQRLQTL